jgi:hypothetical protein
MKDYMRDKLLQTVAMVVPFNHALKRRVGIGQIEKAS